MDGLGVETRGEQTGRTAREEIRRRRIVGEELVALATLWTAQPEGEIGVLPVRCLVPITFVAQRAHRPPVRPKRQREPAPAHSPSCNPDHGAPRPPPPTAPPPHPHAPQPP